MSDPKVFHADAAIFDMDGTLTDSIAAVEAAWAKIAREIGKPPKDVIAAAHGKRSADVFPELKPKLDEKQVLKEVERLEETILYYADAHQKRNDTDAREDWQKEAQSVDRAVRILPGVHELINSLPEGRYAIATSGCETYAYGCLERVGIARPRVMITGNDKRIKQGKPEPDPFLIAIECLGFDPKRCVVFEDSPSGIRAGVASGATVVAVCTSHDSESIKDCGAHYIVENMESVQCESEKDGRLKFTVKPLS